MDYKDYYATLGVSRDAQQEEITKAYRKLARKYHPDVNRGADAEDRFKEVTEAYEVLKDPEKRRTYDRFGKAWKSGGRAGGPPPGFENVRFDFGQGGGSGFSSFFDMLFGGGRGGAGGGDPFAGFSGFGGAGGAGGGQWAAAGSDHEASLELSLEEAAHGGRREVTLADPQSGQRKTYAVTLPEGVKPGQKIRLSGRGGAGSGGGPAGDLYLKVSHRAHPRLRLEGGDLHTQVQVTPWTAALGGQAQVPTLGEPLNVRIPPGSSSGRKIRLRGKGFPGSNGSKGDLFAEIRVMVPEKLSDRERELFEQLAEVSSFEPGA